MHTYNTIQTLTLQYNCHSESSHRLLPRAAVHSQLSRCSSSCSIVVQRHSIVLRLTVSSLGLAHCPFLSVPRHVAFCDCRRQPSAAAARADLLSSIHLHQSPNSMSSRGCRDLHCGSDTQVSGRSEDQPRLVHSADQARLHAAVHHLHLHSRCWPRFHTRSSPSPLPRLPPLLPLLQPLPAQRSLRLTLECTAG